MKHLTLVVAIAALALTCEGAVLPWALAPWHPWVGPAALALPGATVVQSNPPAAVVAAPGAPVVVDASGAPTLVWAHPALAAPVVAVAPAPAPATAVSATRGSVHVAPLEGHTVSQTQLNLAPAPGSE